MAETAPLIAVFASDRGPGDPERASMMSQAGSHFAKRGARLICLADNGYVPVPLITAARTAGGAVQVIADGTITLPKALDGVPLEVLDTAQERLARIGNLATAYVALPGSLSSVTALFNSWAAANAQGRVLPVVMLNRHKAYDVIRGFGNDVMSHQFSAYEKSLQFADSVEDTWNRLQRVLPARG
ncbi:LOG family protein [Devosia sp. RR2S18]|uniref:LOG family protein n=1 Tax=Devosia rhizosphaerae TaxID=3049774 RepID=UPI0025422480|nr:LOG family protein [Devosia sp. RR2S18]WIJ24414.1 LOG family protein [Devosia sp. RR2S18]